MKKSKFQVGDRVVVVHHEGHYFYEAVVGHEFTIIGFRDDGELAYFEKVFKCVDGAYVWRLELASIYNSPLYKALT